MTYGNARHLELMRSDIRPNDVGEDLPVMDEESVVDDRAAIRPAQMVEEKLSRMLHGDCVRVSQLRLRAIIAGRSS